MNAITLFRLLRKNNNLGFRRSPAYEQSLAAKILLGIGAGIFVIYLLVYGTMFGALASDEQEPAFLIAIMPILLLVDFGIRFMVQQIPAVLMKPYMLLPIPRRSVIDTFLVSSLLSIYNWLWLFFFIPYIIIVTAGGCEGWLSCSLLLSGILLLMVNSQFYLMMRTLIGRNLLWWLLPLAVFGSYFSPLLIDTKGEAFESMLDSMVEWGSTLWLPLCCLALLSLIFQLNRMMQHAYVYEEIARQEKSQPTNIKHISQYAFLNRFGETGEYLKLELKSIIRNKAIRARVLMSLSLIVVFSALVAYTDIYNGVLMLNFFCCYCFSLYGITALVKVMGAEGNYIDLLLVHRENILALLRAKYYFHCAILLVPFLIMLPAVMEGKFSMLMMFAYLLFSSGPLYFVLFQLAVTNQQTLPLDQKVTGKAQLENGRQLIVELVGMSLPIVLALVLIAFFSEEIAYGSLIAVGAFFTVLHPLWLRNVYNRMMKRKYENLDGFHASR